MNLLQLEVAGHCTKDKETQVLFIIMHWLLKVSARHVHSHFIGRSKSHGHPRFTRRVVFHLEKTGVGKLGCKQVCILGWETSVANFCHLPHLSLIKPLGFTNVVSPAFEIHPVVISKLR